MCQSVNCCSNERAEEEKQSDIIIEDKPNKTLVNEKPFLL